MALGASFVSAAATPIRQLTNTQASNIRPAWSPDGKQIAFQTNRDGPYHIYVMSADGSNVRQLTSSDADDRHPAWSPDGKQLAIDSGDQTNREIWTIDVGSRQRTQITKLGGIASFPSWSPDGKRIAFYVYQAGSMDVWAAMTDNGSNPLRLTLGRLVPRLEPPRAVRWRLIARPLDVSSRRRPDTDLAAGRAEPLPGLSARRPTRLRDRAHLPGSELDRPVARRSEQRRTAE